MGRFLDEVSKGAIKPVRQGGRFLQAAEEDTTESTVADKGTRHLFDVGKDSGVAKFWGPEFEKQAKTPAGKAVLSGFHALSRPGSELTGALASGISAADKLVPKEGLLGGLIKPNPQDVQEKLIALKAKNISSRPAGGPLDYEPRGESTYPSELLQIAVPGLKVDDETEPFIPGEAKEVLGSGYGNLKRLTNFIVDVAADPLSYVKGPDLSRAGRTAKQVEAATRAGEKISLDSVLAQKIARETGEEPSAASIGKARKSGKLGSLGDTFSDKVQKGQANIGSIDIPFTDVEIPILPRELQVPIARGGEALGKAIFHNPITDPFTKALKRAFSTKTGNSEYDKLRQEFDDLRAFRSDMKIEQAKEFDKRLDQLSKSSKIPRDQLNKMVTEATETKGKIDPTAGAAGVSQLPSKYIAAIKDGDRIIVSKPGIGHYGIADQAPNGIDGFVDETGKFFTRDEAFKNSVERSKHEISGVIDDVARGNDNLVSLLTEGYSDVPEEVLTEIRNIVDNASEEEVRSLFKNSKAEILEVLNEDLPDDFNPRGPQAIISKVPGMGGMPDDLDNFMQEAAEGKGADPLRGMLEDEEFDLLTPEDRARARKITEDYTANKPFVPLEGIDKMTLSQKIEEMRVRFKKINDEIANETEDQLDQTRSEIDDIMQTLDDQGVATARSVLGEDLEDAFDGRQTFIDDFGDTPENIRRAAQEGEDLDNVFAAKDADYAKDLNFNFEAYLDEAHPESIPVWRYLLSGLLEGKESITAWELKQVMDDFINSTDEILKLKGLPDQILDDLDSGKPTMPQLFDEAGKGPKAKTLEDQLKLFEDAIDRDDSSGIRVEGYLWERKGGTNPNDGFKEELENIANDPDDFDVDELMDTASGNEHKRWEQSLIDDLNYIKANKPDMSYEEVVGYYKSRHLNEKEAKKFLDKHGFKPGSDMALEGKFPDTSSNAYDDAKREIAEGVAEDLKAAKPTNIEEAKGYIGRWINYGKEFNGQGLANNSKLDEPIYDQLVKQLELMRGEAVTLPHTIGRDLYAKEQGIIQHLLQNNYAVDPNDFKSMVGGLAELLQDLVVDHDRLALGNLARRKYIPAGMIQQVVGLLRVNLDDLLYTPKNGFVSHDQIDNSINELMRGIPLKIGDDLYGKNIDLMSNQDILEGMAARGAIGAQTPNESLFNQLRRTFPNLFSAPYSFSPRSSPRGGKRANGWIGLNSKPLLAMSQASGLTLEDMMAQIAKDNNNRLPKGLIDRTRVLIQLSPNQRALALKYEDFVINALGNRITKRLTDKLSSQPILAKILSSPEKAAKLYSLMREFAEENGRVFGVPNPNKLGLPSTQALVKNFENIAVVYSEAFTGASKNYTRDARKLQDIAIRVVRDYFEIEPNQLVKNMKAFNKAIKRDPKQAYRDYIKWIKAHESGHNFMGGKTDDSYWSILPKEMRDEYETIWRLDNEKFAEVGDSYDLKSIHENFANANGFYLSFPAIMQDIMPKKYEFFRKIYTPGQRLSADHLLTGQQSIDEIAKLDPTIAHTVQKGNPELFEGTRPLAYSKPPSGDPALDAITRAFKEENQRQIMIEQSSGVKITPLTSDTDYIAHAMTPEARDVVMDLMKKKGTLPKAITAKQFSTKLANAVRRDFTIIKAAKAKEMLDHGEINMKDYKAILKKDTGLDHLDRMLSDGTISEAQFAELVHSMTVSEVNALAAQGKLKLLNGEKVAEFFHEDPVYSTTIRGVRGERARTNVEFYEELKSRGLAIASDKAPPGWIEPNIQELEGFKVEPEVAEHLNAHRKALNDTESPIEFLRLYDQVQDWWKSWTLAIFPSYHSRNFVGNMWNNFLAGVRDPRVYKMASDMQRRSQVVFKDGLGKRWDTDTVLEAAKRHGVIDRGWVGADIQQSVADALEKSKFNTLGRNNKLIEKGFEVGRSIENNARLGHFIDRMMKGDTVAEAATSVKKYLFDYSELTQFERKVMKRLFPFYTWTRKNVPLQVQHLITRPARYSILDKASNQIQTENKPMEKYLPQWMIENYPQRIRYNKKTGNYEYFLLSSWLPAADLAKVFDIQDTATSMLSPIPKEMLQQMFNYDVFLKRKIENIPGEKVKFLGHDMPARLAHGARLIRLLNEADKLTAEDTDIVTKVLGVTTGKVYPFNEEQALIGNTLGVDDELMELKRAARRAEKRGDKAELERIIGLMEQKEQDY